MAASVTIRHDAWRLWATANNVVCRKYAERTDEAHQAVEPESSDNENEDTSQAITTALREHLATTQRHLPVAQRPSFASGFQLALELMASAFGLTSTAASSEEDDAAEEEEAASATQSNTKATQVTTIRGIVLSTHIFNKISMRCRLRRAERRISVLVNQRDDVCRELIRVGSSSRALPSLIMPSHNATPKSTTSISLYKPPDKKSIDANVGAATVAAEKRRVAVVHLLWCMTSTWQRLLAKQKHSPVAVSLSSVPGGSKPPLNVTPPVPPAGMHSSGRCITHGTMDLLGGWLAAHEFLDHHHSSTIPSTAIEYRTSSSRQQQSSYHLQLSELGVESEDLLPMDHPHGATELPMVMSFINDVEASTPIFLCRRCRATGRGDLVYDVGQQKMIRQGNALPPHFSAVRLQHQQGNGNSPNAALTTLVGPISTNVSPRHQPQQPPPLKPAPPVAAASSLIGAPRVVAKRSEKLRDASPKKVVWGSSAQGIYVPHR